MKNILIIIILTTSLFATKYEDKYMHAAIGIGIYVSCVIVKEGIEYYGYTSPLSYTGCLIPVVTAGVGKEVYDHYNIETHTPDIWDAVATIGIPLIFTITIYEW